MMEISLEELLRRLADTNGLPFDAAATYRTAAYLIRAAIKSDYEIGQMCGKALGYPWYKDDQKNFPGATESDGVCIGEHVAESIVAELADTYIRLRQLSRNLRFNHL